MFDFIEPTDWDAVKRRRVRQAQDSCALQRLIDMAGGLGKQDRTKKSHSGRRTHERQGNGSGAVGAD